MSINSNAHAGITCKSVLMSQGKSRNRIIRQAALSQCRLSKLSQINITQHVWVCNERRAARWLPFDPQTLSARMLHRARLSLEPRVQTSARSPRLHTFDNTLNPHPTPDKTYLHRFVDIIYDILGPYRFNNDCDPVGAWTRCGTRVNI